jgi:hypothetical protein
MHSDSSRQWLTTFVPPRIDAIERAFSGVTREGDTAVKEIHERAWRVYIVNRCSEAMSLLFTFGIMLLLCTAPGCSSKPGPIVSENNANHGPSPNESRIPNVSICDVLYDPHRYFSSEIRISGLLARADDFVSLSEERCLPYHPLIVISFDQSTTFDSSNEWGLKVKHIVSGDDEGKKGIGHVPVKAIGTFSELPENERTGEAKYQFKITKLEPY